ncbi:tetraspanin-18B-like [Saccostrea echinata]|uniref:tetraspanin-18B-like n=1 Tax=Saccostrea echinata TaxID=191078 RepID=UPI002A81B201|nr:tetraspanin-18B-like [Saccostrea echinata]
MAGDFCEKFGKWFLVALNILFFLLGLGLLATGALVNINAVFEEVLPTLNKVQVVGNNFGDLLNSISILVIIIGIFVALVAGLGLFGACCENKFMLIGYAILLLILVIMETTTVVFLSKMSMFNDKIKGAMLRELQKKFIDDSFNTSNAFSNGWNYIFLKYDCCGVNPVRGPNNDFDETPWCKQKGECYMNNAQIPKACCIGVDESNFESNATASCYSDVSGNYKTKGCYDRLQEFIQKYSRPAIGVSAVVIVIEILAFVCAIILCKGKSESKAV